MDPDAGLAALQQVAQQLRAAHQTCRRGLGCHEPGCSCRGSCPWPLVTEEDVEELHAMLAEAGFEVTPIGGQ
jgi:hypothetical protein